MTKENIGQMLLRIATEELAALEHEQWMVWSCAVADDIDDSSNGKARLERWQKLWIPYKQLTEDQKEQDRVWARKALAVLGLTEETAMKALMAAQIIPIDTQNKTKGEP